MMDNGNTYTRTELLALHQRSTWNAAQVFELSGKRIKAKCGCFSCGAIFSSDLLQPEHLLIEQDGRKTIFCPYCGTDAVLVDSDDIALGRKLLTQMHTAFFGDNVGTFDSTCHERTELGDFTAAYKNI